MSKNLELNEHGNRIHWIEDNGTEYWSRYWYNEDSVDVRITRFKIKEGFERYCDYDDNGNFIKERFYDDTGRDVKCLEAWYILLNVRKELYG